MSHLGQELGQLMIYLTEFPIDTVWAGINDPAASCGVLGYQRTQQAAGNGPVEIQRRSNHQIV
jgi:hypothetical protein